MAHWDPEWCGFCGKEHRPGKPGYVPMCKIGLSAPGPRVQAEPKTPEPVRTPVEFEPIGEVVPDWAYDLGIRRRRELDEPVVQRKDRLTHNVTMRAYRMRKQLRKQGWDDEAIEQRIAELKVAWEREVREKG